MFSQLMMKGGGWDVENREQFTPLDYFEEYFDDAFFTLAAEQSNIRAMQANETKPLKTTADEMKKLTGAHIMTGVLRIPRLRLYFKLKISSVTVIARDRFFKLRNFLHFVDNLSVTDKRSKLWKVQPILDRIMSRCRKFPYSKNLSVDEQMIPFHGTTALKQYVKGKPNPVGLKNFVLASPDGLLHNFFIYEGANTWPDGRPNINLGVGGSSVEKLITDVPCGHVIYTDRFFSSMNLSEFLLADKGILHVGTIMGNRLPHNLKNKLSTDANLLKKGRGSHEVLVREDNKIAVVKWVDNKGVLMTSTCTGSQPVHNVKRYEKTKREYVYIPRPCIVASYNESMGGVDLLDRYIAYYRISMRTKKWPVRVFFHFIDVAIANSWITYNRDQEMLFVPKKKRMDLLDFKVYIAESLSGCASGQSGRATRANLNFRPDEDIEPGPSAPKKSRPVPHPTKDVRQTGSEHMPICAVTDSNKFPRCRKPGCDKKSRYKCIKCNVFLCIAPERDCFLEYHS